MNKKILPPFHKVMENQGECDYANARIAMLEGCPTVVLKNPPCDMEVTGWDCDSHILTIVCGEDVGV